MQARGDYLQCAKDAFSGICAALYNIHKGLVKNNSSPALICLCILFVRITLQLQK